MCANFCQLITTSLAYVDFFYLGHLARLLYIHLNDFWGIQCISTCESWSNLSVYVSFATCLVWETTFWLNVNAFANAYSILVLASKNAKNLFGVAWWNLARQHLWRFTKATVRSACAPPYLDAFESTRKKIRTTLSGLEELPWIHERECRSVKDRLLRRQGTSWVSCPSLLFKGKSFALASMNTVCPDSFIHAS